MTIFENIFESNKPLFDKLTKNGDRKMILSSCPCHNGRGVIFAARSKNSLVINCSCDSKTTFKVKDYFKK